MPPRGQRSSGLLRLFRDHLPTTFLQLQPRPGSASRAAVLPEAALGASQLAACACARGCRRPHAGQQERQRWHALAGGCRDGRSCCCATCGVIGRGRRAFGRFRDAAAGLAPDDVGLLGTTGRLMHWPPRGLRHKRRWAGCPLGGRGAASRRLLPREPLPPLRGLRLRQHCPAELVHLERRVAPSNPQGALLGRCGLHRRRRPSCAGRAGRCRVVHERHHLPQPGCLLGAAVANGWARSGPLRCSLSAWWLRSRTAP